MSQALVATQEVVSIFDTPEWEQAKTQRQLVMGEAFHPERKSAPDRNPVSEWIFGRAERDGYEGWVQVLSVGPSPGPMTHVVKVRESLRLPDPDEKNGPSPVWLSFGSRVSARRSSDDGKWTEILTQQNGLTQWVPTAHLRPIDEAETDPVDVARRFLGTPYVWGGNSGRGLDCSGLVQAALLACQISCPGDSGPQRDAFAEPDRDGPYEPGELLFWKGHVAMATGPDTMIHATAHTMSVIEEPLLPALARIEATGDTPFLGRGRPG